MPREDKTASAAKDARIEELIRLGVHTSAIAERLGMKQSSVVRRLKNLGWEYAGGRYGDWIKKP